MEFFKKVSVLSALLLAAASTASAFVPRTTTCGAPHGGLFMSAVTESASGTDTGEQPIENLRLVAEIIDRICTS